MQPAPFATPAAAFLVRPADRALTAVFSGEGRAASGVSSAGCRCSLNAPGCVQFRPQVQTKRRTSWEELAREEIALCFDGFEGDIKLS
ncbi:MAG: hypothetical protein ACREFP_18870 [Acetobacteraceae bacterium]